MRIFGFYFILLSVLVACGPKVIYNESQTLDSSWPYDKYAHFNYQIQDTLRAYDLILTLHHDRDYGYENLYVMAETTFPDNTSIANPVSLQLANDQGMWLGKCDDDRCKTEIVISSQAYFKSIGDYSLKLQQYSRSDSLKGVYGIDLRIQVAETN